MDKSSGNSDPRDITLGCGPTSTNNVSSIPSTTAAASASGSATAGATLNLGTPPPITLNITTTTGGNFTVVVDILNNVEMLKKIIAKKLKVAKDRICLLHRER